MAKGKRQGIGPVIFRLLFVVYVVLMLWLLFGQRLGTVIYEQNLAEGMNLQPFATMAMYWRLLKGNASPYYIRHAFINLAGNVIMFVPLGYFLPKLFEKLRALWKTFLFSLCLVITVEAVQYFTLLGTCDVDDLILNMVGVILGYLLWRILRR